mgnify:CR=1 FL=1
MTIKEFKNIEDSDQAWTTVKEMEKLYKVWEKENITDIEEKNKITTNKLNSDLETALQINKNAIAEKQKQIADLKELLYAYSHGLLKEKDSNKI